MSIKVVCKNCETVNKVKNATIKNYGKAHPESAMTLEFRVCTSLNGNYSVLFTAPDYQAAEKFCWEQDCPFELTIEKKWVKRTNLTN